MTMATKDPKMGAKDELPAVYGKSETTPLKETVHRERPQQLQVRAEVNLVHWCGDQ